MSYRQKYYASIVFFVFTVIFMFYIQGKMIDAGYAGQLSADIVMWMILSVVLLIVSIITFAIARSRRDKSDISSEELLIMSEEFKNKNKLKP